MICTKMIWICVVFGRSSRRLQAAEFRLLDKLRRRTSLPTRTRFRPMEARSWASATQGMVGSRAMVGAGGGSEHGRRPAKRGYARRFRRWMCDCWRESAPSQEAKRIGGPRRRDSLAWVIYRADWWAVTARDVSADGSFVVGSSASDTRRRSISLDGRTGMVGLGRVSRRRLSHSCDCVRTTVRSSWESRTLGRPTFEREAFRWTAATGIVGLGELPGGGLT